MKIILESGDRAWAVEVLEESRFIRLDPDPSHHGEPTQPPSRYLPELCQRCTAAPEGGGLRLPPGHSSVEAD
jgi:hypothetical protein